MSNNLLTLVAAMGEAIRSDAITGVKLQFEPTDRFEVVFPSNSVDPFEVKHTASIKYSIVLTYMGGASDGAVEVAEGEAPLVAESRAVLNSGNIELRSGRLTLTQSEPYMALSDVARKNLEKRIRNFKNQLLTEERIRFAIERQANPVNMADPAVDLAPEVSRTELAISDADAEAQAVRKQYIADKISNYQNKSAAPLSLRDMQAQLGEDADRLLSQAVQALQTQVANLNR